MSDRSKWWQDDAARDPEFDAAVQHLDGLSPAHAYLLRQLAQLDARARESSAELARLGAAVAALTDLLLQTGALDEGALRARIERAPPDDDAGAQAGTGANEADAPRDQVVLTTRGPRGTRLGPGLAAPQPPEPATAPVGNPRATQQSPQPAQPTQAQPAQPTQTPQPAQGQAATPAPAAPTATFFDHDYDDELPRSGRGLRVAGLLIVATALVAVPLWYYGIRTNPYYGDGPTHLQVDPQRPRTRAAGTTPEASPASAPTARPAAAKTPRVATKVIPNDTPKVAPKGVAKPAPEPPPDLTRVRYAALIARAQALVSKGRAGAALRLFSDAAKIDPNGWEALERLAWRDYSRGATARGRKLAARALVANPAAPYAVLVEAAAAHERGQRAVAKAGYQRFLALCKGCPEAADIRAALRSL